MADPLEVTCELVNERLHFRGKNSTQPPIDIDYIPPIGDNLGYTSLELLLISLASCSGSTLTSLLRRMKKTVSGCGIKARGLRRAQHPTSFEKITLEFTINSGDAQKADIDKALELSEETFCPVWTMLKNSVEIVTEYKIIR